MSIGRADAQMMRLKHVASVSVSNVDKKSADSEQPVRLCNYTDVYYHANITDDLPFMEATATDTQIEQFTLRAGDVVITKDSETPDDIAVPAFVKETLDNVVCGYHLAVIRPNTALLHPKFLYWTLASTPLREWFGSEATGVTRFGLRTDSVANTLIRVPDQVTQRRLTAFLDAEMARIDGLIEKRRRMIGLLDEKWSAGLSTAFNVPSGLRLKHLLAAPLAYGVLVPEHDAAGVPMLRITDLRNEAVDLEAVARIPETLSAEYRRTIIRSGDLVVSVVGTLGRCVEVDAELAGCNLNRALARVQLQPDVPRSLVRFWFQSQQFADQASVATSGDSAQPTLGLGDMKNFAVGLPHSRSTWHAIAAELDDREARVVLTKSILRRQIELLDERRRTLITAAVTGELDLSEAA